MGKINPSFPHNIFTFLHRPIRDLDQKEGSNFVERFLTGPQKVFEDTQARIQLVKTLNNPAKIRSDLLQYLKDHVGLTRDIQNIINDLSENDLRKLIQLAVPLWKQKGLEIGYKNIIRIFTGKGSRVFNWFDFRWIIGEKAFGSELQGEDAFLISAIGVEAFTPLGNVALLLNFENGVRDGSINQNDAVDHAALNYFQPGAVVGSSYYANFDGGQTYLPLNPVPISGDIITVPFDSAYDFSGDFTIELFYRTTFSQDAILFKWANASGNREVSIRLKSSTNDVIYVLKDGATTVTGSLGALVNLDDGVWHHVALIVNRTQNKARLYVAGTEKTAGENIAALGDLTVTGAQMFIGGATFDTLLYRGDLDSFRISLSDQYNLTNVSIPVPGLPFFGYQEEQLDEFKTDIRVVDDGNLNKVLIRRILNLMRPSSERLNVIYVQQFDDFTFGKGDFFAVASGSSLANSNFVIPTGAIEHVDHEGSGDYQDMVLQVRQKFTVAGEFGIRFFIQDNNNFYRYIFNVVGADSEARLEKVVAGIITIIDGPFVIPIFMDTFYIWTITTDFNSISGETLIKSFQDGNVVNEIVDTTFNKGTWGVEGVSGVGGRSEISEVELFVRPLEVETVNPGFAL